MQQLLDKWERLRRSEYLRPDEKLMLNHCISDLKRFMDHSGEVNEMVNKQQTALEWLEKICNDRGYYLMSEYFEQAKEMEKGKLEDAWVEGVKNWNPSKTFEQYYEETYGGNK
jgi:hypothetical protein